MDKKSVEAQPAVRLCNYTDVYHRDTIAPYQEFMSATATPEQVETFRLMRGDVLITKDSETPEDIGVPAFVADGASDLVCGYHLALIRPRAGRVEPRFLYWSMCSRGTRAQLTIAATGVTRFGLRRDDMSGVRLQLPPLDEQRRIASFLDAELARIDDLIATRQRHLQVMEERSSAEISTAIDSSATSLTRFKRMLVEPPVYGANAAADRADGTEPRYIRITDIRGDGTLRADTYRSLPIDLARPYLLQSGDLLFARSGATVGKAFLYDASHHDHPACHAGYLIRARIDRRRAIPTFAYYWARSRRYWDEIGLTLIQATIPNVSAQRYANLPFPAASTDVQRSTVERLDASLEHVNRFRSTARNQFRALRERREALVTAAVTGQLDPSSYRASALTA